MPRRSFFFLIAMSALLALGLRARGRTGITTPSTFPAGTDTRRQIVPICASALTTRMPWCVPKSAL